MTHPPTHVLSLAFQRTYPHVYGRAQDLLRIRQQGSEPRLAWPSWCHFPVGLSYDLLRQHYGYSHEGVEPFLLSALVGFWAQRAIIHLDAGVFLDSAETRACAALSVSALFSRPLFCFYVAYPTYPTCSNDDGEAPGALGSFLFLDYNGPGDESLIFVLHLDLYHVEPICFPLTSGRSSFEELHFDLERALRSERPAGLSPEFLRRAVRLCRVNLRILEQQSVRQPEAVLQ